MDHSHRPMPSEHARLIDRILNGRPRVASPAELESLLADVADDPDLFRRLADHLSDAASTATALAAYRKAVDRYLDGGMVLQAIVAQLSAWSLVKPSHRAGRAFHAMVRRKGTGDHPAQLLFSQLTYAEMVSLLRRLTRVRIQPGETVVDIGQEASHLYFIVSGELTEFPLANRQDGAVGGTLLAENDLFGDIFPLEEKSFNRTRVVAATPGELVKIAKPALRALCYRFPHVRELLERLSRRRVGGGRDRLWKTVRRACRYYLPAAVRLSFPADGEPDGDVLDGTSRDLSAGGMCVALDDRFRNRNGGGRLGQPAALTILDNGRPVIGGLTGKVAWHKTVGNHSRPTRLLGVTFGPMAAETAMALNTFCTIVNDEQDMIWDLWNHLVRH